jgi:hypothetical protein
MNWQEAKEAMRSGRRVRLPDFARGACLVMNGEQIISRVVLPGYEEENPIFDVSKLEDREDFEVWPDV